MATFRLPILGHALYPDTTGKAWVEPSTILGSNNVTNALVLRIDEDVNNNTALTTKAGFYGQFNVPKNYVGTASIVIVWESTKTSGDVVFDFDYRAVGGNDAESFDQASWQESVTVTDAAGSAAYERMECSVNLTSANLAADDTVVFFIGCDGTDGADTLAGARRIRDVLFQYADA